MGQTRQQLRRQQAPRAYRRSSSALAELKRAQDQLKDPIAVLDRVIASAHNQRETLNDPTAHAEMIAITQAAEAVGTWRLDDCALYVTLEPCAMCAGAIVQARLPLVVYGATDPKAGAVQSLFHLLNDARFNHQAQTVAQVLAKECGEILTRFFKEQRKLGKK